jgi:MoaA/NifB/PqqE/SkfB family radical SAM enzyme
MNIKAFLNTINSTARCLPIVILFLTEECNLKCISCSYRSALPGELTLDEIKELSVQLKSLGLRHIVYSGGEPLLRKDFIDICKIFASLDVKQSLLTNGLLLEKRVRDIYKYFHEIIVSIDGADAATHNAVRGLNSFDQIIKGIKTFLSLPGHGEISIRTVIQKKNFRQITGMVKNAKSIGVNRISFLSADVSPGAFGRIDKQNEFNEKDLLLDENEVNEFRKILNELFDEHKADFESGFISESPAKLLRLADYFAAHLGKSNFPKNLCNAPNVSAVITSTGEIQPCFFLPAYGNVRKNPVSEIVNSDSVKQTRDDLKHNSIERCKTCVCTLYVNARSALNNKF